MGSLLRICIPGAPQGTGGVVTFRRKLVRALVEKDIEVEYELDHNCFDAVLVINGTRQLAGLWRAKKKGVRIVHRLGGLNWMHRFGSVSIRDYLLAEIRNLTMRLIRSSLADFVVYQSKFVETWWNQEYGAPGVDSTVIHNGVDLDLFKPQGSKYVSPADTCIISVEGTQGNDPCDIAIRLSSVLQRIGNSVELLMFGKSSGDIASRYSSYPFVSFMGVKPNSELAYFYRGATFYISTDVIAACPNAVLEALACGTPILGYKAGALSELVTSDAGYTVSPQGDPWQVENPGNYQEMVEAALDLTNRNHLFRRGARDLAESRYGLERMVDAYLRVFIG